jgi:hypothetical protein
MVHTGELHNLYQIKENEVDEACGMGKERKVYQGFGGKASSKEISWKTEA